MVYHGVFYILIKQNKLTVGYYYHIPVYSKDSKVFVPGYLGVFLNALASEVEVLYLFMHQCNQLQQLDADYELQQKNIVFVNLGPTSPAWYRHLFHKKILQPITPFAEICDALIIRSPTPLAPFFKKYITKPRLFFMVVGDYLEGAKQFKIKGLRDWIMIQYLKRNDHLFRQSMRTTDVLVNSPDLLNKYKNISRSIKLIRTTTLTKNDFFERTDTCNNNLIEILYTGRIEAAKGLFELVEAVAQLNTNNLNVQLNIAGWEAGNNKLVEKALLSKALEFKIDNKVIFHGKKKIGEELNTLYRKADIYVIPSYHEGFPRTIWEAMANSLPVVATSVGGIPDYLTHGENALFVQPKNSNDLAKKIEAIIKDQQLRSKLIKNGYALAQTNTIEIQTNNIIKIIEKLIITK